MDERAQGSMEYLLLIGGGVLISVIIITLILQLSGTSKGGVASNYNAYQSIFDRYEH